MIDKIENIFKERVIDFPIATREENTFVNLTGTKSEFFFLHGIDFEQLDENKLVSFYSELEKSLGLMEDGAFSKLYYLDGKLAFNSSSKNLTLPMQKTASDKGLEFFFGDFDIFSQVGFFDDYLKLNGEYVRILTLTKYPESLSFNYLMNLSDFVVSFRKVDVIESKKKMEGIRQSHLANFFKTKKDVEGNLAYNQAEEFLERLTQGKVAEFNTTVSFIIRESSLEDLSLKTKDLIKKLNLLGAEFLIEGNSLLKRKVGLSTIFSSLIPGANPAFEHRGISTPSDYLTCILPLFAEGLFDSGIPFEAVSGKKLFIDPFNKSVTNRNVLISGTSGQGKSVLANKIIHHLLKDKEVKAVILDKGGSFKRTAIYHDGVNFSGSFNPWRFRDPDYLLEFVLSVTGNHEFSKKDQGLLLKKIREVSKDESVKNFKEFILRLESEFKELSLYFEEIFPYFSEDIQNEFPSITYVDVANYPTPVVKSLIVFMVEYFNNLPTTKKVFVIDECFEFLKNHVSFVDWLFRSIRKTGGMCMAMAQSIKDFAGTFGEASAAGIINSSYFKFFMPQEDPGNIADFNDFDRERLKEVKFIKGEYSDSYLKTSDGKIKKILRNRLLGLELELFHTEQGEDVPFWNFYNKNRSFFESNRECIEGYVRLKHAV